MWGGNESDQKEFGVGVIELKKKLQFDSLMVVDSAFYTQENIQIVDKLKWLSRVPLTVKAATLLAKSVEDKDLITSQIPGYNYVEIKPYYAAVEQRWLLVESHKRKESDLKNLSKKIQKDKEACQNTNYYYVIYVKVRVIEAKICTTFKTLVICKYVSAHGYILGLSSFFD